MKKLFLAKHGKLFYTMTALLVAFIIIPILTALVISLHILKQSELQMRDSIANTLSIQVKYMQAASPARQRTSLNEYFRALNLENLSSFDIMPQNDETKSVEEALAESLNMTRSTTGEKRNYIYFVKSDYLMGTEMSGRSVWDYESGYLRRAWANVDLSDTSYSASQYFSSADTGMCYTISISYLCRNVYLVSEHIYSMEEGPTDSLSEDFLSSFTDMEFAYYDQYGGYHTATAKNTLSALYSYHTLGAEDSGNFSFEWSGHRYLAFYVSNSDNMTRMALFCRDDISESRQMTKSLLILSMVCFVIFCILAASIVLNRTYSPIGQLVTEIAPNQSGLRDDADILASALRKRDYHLKEQSGLLEQCYYLRLLRGLDAEMIEAYRSAWLQEDGEYLVAAVRMEAIGEDLLLREDDICERFHSFMDREGYDTVCVPSGEFCYLIVKGGVKELSAQALMYTFLTFQGEWTDCSFSVYISNPVKGTAGLSRAYSQAMETAEYCAELEQYARVICFDQIPVKTTVDATLTVFSQFQEYSSSICALDSDQALKIFDSIAVQASSAVGHTLQPSDALFTSLVSTTALAFYRLNIPDDADKKHVQTHMKAVYQAESLEMLRQVLADSLAEFTSLNDNTDWDKKNYNRLQTFIRANLSDQNLSSAMVAEHFGMSSANITRLFKKFNHSGFLEYIHQLRVNKACVLLRETDLTISEIALKVGYSNTITMTRAFKNYANATPGAFRKKMKDVDDDD